MDDVLANEHEMRRRDEAVQRSEIRDDVIMEDERTHAIQQSRGGMSGAWGSKESGNNGRD